MPSSYEQLKGEIGVAVCFVNANAWIIVTILSEKIITRATALLIMVIWLLIAYSINRIYKSK